MEKDRKQRIVLALISQDKLDTDGKKYDLIYQLLRERHELQQVCLEVCRGLERENRPALIEKHWHSELIRVLFEQCHFIH